MSIRVMHVISGLDQGGAEAMLVRLLRTLDRRSFSQAPVSLASRGIYGDQVEAAGVPLLTLDLTGFATTPGSLAVLSRAISEQQPAIVQTWLYHADLLGLLAARMVSDAAVAWNVRCAGVGPGDLPRSTLWLTRLLARLSSWPDAVLFNSAAGVVAHRAIGYRPRRTEVIPNGFDLEERRPDAIRRAEFRAEIGIDDGTFLVGMIARSHRVKDQATFLAAAAQLKGMGPIRFVLVGLNHTWSNTSLVADIDRYGLRDRIALLGLRQDVPRIMAGLDCLVSTSTSEGFPNVIGEAMASGVPCVTTDAGDSRLIVGDTGTIVPIGDIAGVVAGVSQLMAAGVEERQLRSQQCRRRIVDHFELSRVADRYAEFYGELNDKRLVARHGAVVSVGIGTNDFIDEVKRALDEARDAGTEAGGRELAPRSWRRRFADLFVAIATNRWIGRPREECASSGYFSGNRARVLARFAVAVVYASIFYTPLVSFAGSRLTIRQPHRRVHLHQQRLPAARARRGSVLQGRVRPAASHFIRVRADVC